MERIPEPELMVGAEQARAYASADFDDVNAAFTERFLGLLDGAARVGVAVDLGCGPGDIAIRACRAAAGLRVVGVDGSPAMLAHARRAIARAGLDGRIELVCATLPGATPGRRFDAVMSNSLLHHLADPDVLWQEIRAVAGPGAPVLVVDLLRPNSEAAARALVEEHAAGEAAVLREDFFNSLRAAYTVAEIDVQLARAGLTGALTVERISDRHVAVSGRLP